ncbi:13353_t:CDS:1, partial [Acaulospora colombiana]
MPHVKDRPVLDILPISSNFITSVNEARESSSTSFELSEDLDSLFTYDSCSSDTSFAQESSGINLAGTNRTTHLYRD